MSDSILPVALDSTVKAEDGLGRHTPNQHHLPVTTQAAQAVKWLILGAERVALYKFIMWGWECKETWMCSNHVGKINLKNYWRHQKRGRV